MPSKEHPVPLCYARKQVMVESKLSSSEISKLCVHVVWATLVVLHDFNCKGELGNGVQGFVCGIVS